MRRYGSGDVYGYDIQAELELKLNLRSKFNWSEQVACYHLKLAGKNRILKGRVVRKSACCGLPAAKPAKLFTHP